MNSFTLSNRRSKPSGIEVVLTTRGSGKPEAASAAEV